MNQALLASLHAELDDPRDLETCNRIQPSYDFEVSSVFGLLSARCYFKHLAGQVVASLRSSAVQLSQHFGKRFSWIPSLLYFVQLVVDGC